ncbi:cytochrome c [Hyphomicrobium sp. D-2]|uniref:c-type cytochrome n=1 Tax=Hyphomicrobium sp. D-2 TaxID=3041621 RepID=UPI00245572BA|nr:cytochrome c [Hyphomicrobium sp. D-2]MDH4980765.1 cytochrome c [Hyphomicrobium sp. D-2]
MAETFAGRGSSGRAVKASVVLPALLLGLTLLAAYQPLAAADAGTDAAAAAPVAQADAIEKGRGLLTENCARCHAIGAEGASPHKEAPPFRVVVTRYPPDNLAEALAEGLVSGHPDMPEFVFEVEEVGAITAYLNSLEPKTE